MNFDMDVFSGVGFGFEYYDDFIFGRGLMVDILCFRVVIEW
jgi:hypothetical protein